ncbi:MAG: hypothetical protein BRC40_05895 [Cyanobacteria bacterium QH_8_48_120]|nr:MAG: hypothetical protein BRC38_10600 [Cyanobacteria bacterium QH_6_48_35]PSO75050.1 MAG: hypothetical protein BRC40_05895 [Cyanobacteria bacterium QH_8_48_120]
MQTDNLFHKQCCCYYHLSYGLPIIITNCSNNYGPYHFPEKLIPLKFLLRSIIFSLIADCCFTTTYSTPVIPLTRGTTHPLEDHQKRDRLLPLPYSWD